jgi:hypothetical protein
MSLAERNPDRRRRHQRHGKEGSEEPTNLEHLAHRMRAYRPLHFASWFSFECG